MEITITDEQLKQGGFSENEIRLELACLFFKLGVYTTGKAAAFAAIPHVQFLDELAKRKIALNDSIDQLTLSVENLRKLRK